MNNLINSIQYYSTIENEELFIFIKNDLQSIEIYQYDENLRLIPFINTTETADLILIDDFTQIGWKQILFLKTNFNLNSFILTDFSQIHLFHQQSDYEYNVSKIILNTKKKA
jgi:hypothetical protein